MKIISDFIYSIIEDSALVKNSALVFLSTAISYGIFFLVNLYFSRLFDPELFGIFKTITYLFALLPILIDFGMMMTLPKYIAEFKIKNKKKISYMVRWFFKLRIISFVIFLFVLFLFKTEIASYFLHDPSLSYLVLAGLFIVGASFFNILRQMVMGYEDFKLFSLSNVLTSIVFAFFGILLGYFFGIFYAIFSYGIGILIGNIICLKFLIRKDSFKKNDGKFNIGKIFWSYSIPIHFFLILPNNLGTSIVPIMSLFFSNKLMGYYSFAFMFYYATLLIPTSLHSVLFPRVSRLNGIKKHEESKKSLIRVLRLYTLFVIFGTICVLLLSEWFVSLIAIEYLPGLTLFKVLIILGLFLGYFSVYGTYLSAKGEIKKTAIVILSQNLILFVISFVLLWNMV